MTYVQLICVRILLFCAFCFSFSGLVRLRFFQFRIAFLKNGSLSQLKFILREPPCLLNERKKNAVTCITTTGETSTWQTMRTKIWWLWFSYQFDFCSFEYCFERSNHFRRGDTTSSAIQLEYSADMPRGYGLADWTDCTACNHRYRYWASPRRGNIL